MSYRSRGLRTRRPSSVEGSPTPLPKFSSYLARAPWRRLSVAVLPCVGVCGNPVRTECGNVCGSQDLQTHLYWRTLKLSVKNSPFFRRAPPFAMKKRLTLLARAAENFGHFAV